MSHVERRLVADVEVVLVLGCMLIVSGKCRWGGDQTIVVTHKIVVIDVIACP